MAPEKVEIVLDGKDAGLVRAWLAGRDSVAAYEAGLKKLEPVTRENAKAAANFERAAKQAYEATRTPLEKFNREQEKLDDLFATGLIDIQTYNRAMQQQKQILEQSDAALQARLASEREQANLAARVIQSLITPQERYAQKLRELKALTDAGKLTTDQFAAAVSREKAALDAADESLQKQKRDQEQLGASAKRVIDSLLTPQERYNQKLIELRRLLAAGALTQLQFNRAVAGAKHELDAAGKAGTTALGNIGGQIGGLLVGYTSIATAITKILDANRQWIDDTEEVGKSFDRVIRKFQVQAGLSDLEKTEHGRAILTGARTAGVDKDFAGKVATQLVSSGFATDEASGAALKVALKGFAASNLLNQDPTQLTQSLGQFLEAQGLEKNAKNLENLLIGSQRLFKATDFQVSDLSQLAAKSQGLAGRLKPEEVLAAFDVLRGKTDAEKGSTALKIFGERLTGANEKKEQRDALKELKLKPEDVDFLDEDVQTVLDRLGKAFDAVPEKRRSGLLQKLFGTEASSPIEGLLRDRAKVGEALKVIQDRAGYDEAVRIGTSGRQAAANRIQIDKELALLGEDQKFDLHRASFEATMLERGSSNVGRSLALGIYDTAAALGFSPETATFLGTTGGAEGQLTRQQTAERVQQAEDPEAFRREQLALLRSMDRRLEENGKKPPVKVIPKDNRQPPAPVSAAALGGPQ